MMEIIFIIVMFAGFILPAVLFHMYWIAYVFAIFGVVFGAFEGFAKWKTGKTVSQNFWAFSKDHPVKAWIVLIGMQVAWLALLWHLASKMIGK